MMVLEAMIGILYAGFASAVLFAKVWAAQGWANVSFSSVMVVRYGLGVDPNEVLNVSEDDDIVLGDFESDSESEHRRKPMRRAQSILSVAETAARDKKPLPLLEFRILNNVDVSRSLLLNAEVRCVVSAESNSERLQYNRVMKNAGLSTPSQPFQPNSSRFIDKEARHSYRHSISDKAAEKPQSIDRRGLMKSSLYSSQTTKFTSATKHIRRARDLVDVDMNNPNRSMDSLLLGNENKFHEVKIQCPLVPIFQRCWDVVHILDETSPLVRKSVRRKIKKYRCWPEEYNSANGMRRALRHFGKIDIIFQTVTHSGIVAYQHKSYSFSDLIIG